MESSIFKYIKEKKAHFEKLPKAPPSLHEFIKQMGILGGFLARTNDGDPGPKTICQGFIKMHSLVEGWELYQKFYNTCG